MSPERYIRFLALVHDKKVNIELIAKAIPVRLMSRSLIRAKTNSVINFIVALLTKKCFSINVDKIIPILCTY